jgi:hypothetical protein
VAQFSYSIPVPAPAHLLHLCLHGVNVLQSPFLRVHPSLNRSIFSWQTERVPSNGVQDLVALHVLEACQHIGYGVDSKMAEMQRARGVWEHGQNIGLALVGGAQFVPSRCQFVPVRLPFCDERLNLGVLNSSLSLGSRCGPL